MNQRSTSKMLKYCIFHFMWKLKCFRTAEINQLDSSCSIQPLKTYNTNKIGTIFVQINENRLNCSSVTSFVICSSLICILLRNLINLRWQNNGLPIQMAKFEKCARQRWQRYKMWNKHYILQIQFGNVEWHCMTHLRTNWVSISDSCFLRLANTFHVVRCINSSIGSLLIINCSCSLNRTAWYMTEWIEYLIRSYTKW